MRLVVTVLAVGYAIIGLIFFATSLYLYFTGTDNKAIWRFNTLVVWIVVVLGLILVAGSLLMSLTGWTVT
jgi:hypothetical protein